MHNFSAKKALGPVAGSSQRFLHQPYDCTYYIWQHYSVFGNVNLRGLLPQALETTMSDISKYLNINQPRELILELDLYFLAAMQHQRLEGM